MTARTSPQTPGTPTWLDIWSEDMAGTRQFFLDLLDHDIPEGDPNYGGYTIAMSQGRYAFGIGPSMPGAAHDTTAMYFATDDVDASAERVRDLGGQVVIDPTDVADTGRMAIAVDPAGVTFALWQAAPVVGYGAVDEPGFPCWQDCLTTDVQASADFYAGLFGFTYEPMTPDGAVVLAKLGDDGHFTIGACTEADEPHWVTYLLVDDVDAMTRRAQEVGGRVATPPTDLPFGRFAHLRTPGGAPFGFFVAGEMPADDAP